MPELHLPPRQHIHQIDDDDPLRYYYLAHTRYLYRKRLRMALASLGEQRFGRLLEIDYGSGILLPTLAGICDDPTGVDIHDKVEQVQLMLGKEGVRANLRQGSVLDLPFQEGEFDAVVSLSVLEHLEELEVALYEIGRVAKPGATIVLGFPVRNVVTSSFFRLVGYDHMEIHPSSHRDILNAARSEFTYLEVTRFPPLLPIDLSLYVICRCVKGR